MPILASEADDRLVDATDLAKFPGAPFEQEVVDAAAQLVRDATEWHVAPVRPETIVVDSAGGRLLFLPTMNLVEVTEVRDVTYDPDGVLVTGYATAATARFRAGVLDRPGGWPVGQIELDVVHGYDGCPANLAAAVAEICRHFGREDLASRSLGDLSESWRESLSLLSQQALAQYEIPGSP